MLRTLAGDDFLDGHEGTDLLDGGVDIDRCVNGETVIDCEKSELDDARDWRRFREPRILRILTGSPSGLLAAIGSRV